MAVLWTIVLAALLEFGYSDLTHQVEEPLTWGLGYDPGTPWPMPSSYQTSADRNQLDEMNFVFNTNVPDCDVLQSAFTRYYKYIFYGPTSSKRSRFSRAVMMEQKFRVGDSFITSLSVQVSGGCVNGELPTLETVESYTLDVMTGSAVLSAPTAWGALRGLETFSQLVYRSNGEYFVNNTKIQDTPRFQHRGLLLDTSRHFIPLKILKQNLDAMGMNKMNVFHWHIVDDQSFPYESRVLPGLSEKGAYNARTHVYTQDDIADLIEYARRWGIRVVPEFDTPGHSQSWGRSQPDLLTKCYTGTTPNGNYGPIDPTVNTTFTFLNTLLKELFQVFPDKYIHLGGDEVSFSCWQSSPVIKAFMQKMGFGTDFAKLEGYYIARLLDLIQSLSKEKGYIVWQEVIDNGVKVDQKNVVVEAWLGHDGGFKKELAKLTKMGYKTILSACWYLDYISYGTEWYKYYNCEPGDFDGTEEQKKLVMGGEACMWGEYVDGTNVISRTWPRASAVAERLWSPQSVKSTAAATPRLKEMRCRMLRRGLDVEPINGPGYCDVEVQV